MAKVNSTFNRKLDTYMDAVVQRAYDELNDLEACAGIKGNADLAYKARANHYGHYTPNGGYAPPRIWVNVATRDSDVGASLKEIIKSRLVAARQRQGFNRSLGYTFGFRSEASDVTVAAEHPTRPFDNGSDRNGPRNIMAAIARQMAENQRNFIKSWGVTPENPDSTVKRKGPNKPPMVWTGALVKGIKGWVQTTTAHVEASVKKANKDES